MLCLSEAIRPEASVWGLLLLGANKGVGVKQAAWLVYLQKKGHGTMDQPFEPLPLDEDMPDPRANPGS